MTPSPDLLAVLREALEGAREGFVRLRDYIPAPGKEAAALDALQCHNIPAAIMRIDSAIRAHEAQGWQTIDKAPKDGTRILLWIVHQTAKYSADPIGEGWMSPCIGKWIDHNGGGWTHSGLCGTPTHWMPLPPPPEPQQ